MKKTSSTPKGSTMDVLLQGIVTKNSFYRTTRREAAQVKYPPITAIKRTAYKMSSPRKVTSILSMTSIPSQATCKQMQNACAAKGYLSVSTDVGVFTPELLSTLLKIHELCEIKSCVKREESWLNSIDMTTPSPECSLKPDDIKSYTNLIFNNPDGNCVLKDQPFILASDLATLSGQGWLTHSILAGVVNIVQKDADKTAPFMLNDLLMMKEEPRNNFLSQKVKNGTGGVAFIVNVGKVNGEVYTSSPSKSGCHWTLLYVDILKNNWYYCDTNCWNMPSDLIGLATPIVKAVYKAIGLPFTPPNIIIAHHGDKKASHNVCSSKCLKNIPIQACANICGVAVAVLASIACFAPCFWRKYFLCREEVLPDHLHWIKSPSNHSDFLRCTLISWLVQESIDITTIGIPDERGCGGDILEKVVDSLDNRSGGIMVEEERKDDDAKINEENGNENVNNADETENNQHDAATKGEKKTRCNDMKKDEDVGPEMKDNEGKQETAFEVDGGPGVVGESDNKEEINDGDKTKKRKLDDVDDCKETKESNEMGEGVATTSDEGRQKENKSDGERNYAKSENSKCSFFVGQKFSSYEELMKVKREYEDKNFCELYKFDTRRLDSGSKRAPNKVAIAKASLEYYSLKLICKFGGKTLPVRTDRKRKTSTFKQGCKFEVYILLSDDGQHLIVSRIKPDHNHELRKDIYEHLPRQRASRNKEALKEMQDALKLQANPKLLQTQIEEKTGQKLTLKDISNVRSNLRKEVDRNSLEEVIRFVRNKGALADVIVDEEKNFKGLFYQDAYMQNIFKHFPELILVDATYKLLDLRMPVYVIMCVDGNGLSEIVAVFIVAEETKEVIESAVEIFKRHNSSWCDVKVVMSDKDFTERDVFTKCFPAANLNICLYHTLRSFSREITCEKMGITNAERLRVLEVLSALAHAKSENKYDTQLDMLRNTKITSVVDFFLKNWHPIREQWVSFFKDRQMNLGETTNNRLESTFSKIKSVCNKYSSLVQFFSEFHSVLDCLRNERNHSFVMALARKQTETGRLSEDLNLYADYLTPYAFKFVQEQLTSSEDIKVASQVGDVYNLSSSKGKTPVTHATTTTTCDCSFYSRMKLPCKHIFKARAHSNVSVFDASLCNKRWTMEHYRNLERCPRPLNLLKEHADLEKEFEIDVNVTNVPEKPSKTLDQAQKYNKALSIAKTLATLASEVGMRTFKQRRNVLESIMLSWEAGHEVAVFDVDEIKNHESAMNECVDQKPNKNDREDDLDTLSKKEKITKDEELQPCNKSPDNTSNNDPKLAEIKMPPKVLKRGRPKGNETTAIGLPKSKCKKKNKLLPFSKLSPNEKTREILLYVTSELTAGEAMAGKRLLTKEDMLSLHEVSDAIIDNRNIDINRIQRYFDKDSWLHVLEIKEMKSKTAMSCSVCEKGINDNTQDSIACDRCLLWSHFNCTNLKQKPKKSVWFCKSCKVKFI